MFMTTSPGLLVFTRTQIPHSPTEELCDTPSVEQNMAKKRGPIRVAHRKHRSDSPRTDQPSLTTSDLDKAETLNTHFVSVFTQDDTDNIPEFEDKEVSWII